MAETVYHRGHRAGRGDRACGNSVSHARDEGLARVCAPVFYPDFARRLAGLRAGSPGLFGHDFPASTPVAGPAASRGYRALWPADRRLALSQSLVDFETPHRDLTP